MIQTQTRLIFFKSSGHILPLLDEHHNASPKYLWRLLADSSDFFCKMIRLIFRSRKDEHPIEELPDDQKNIASNAYRLLREWRLPPGCRAQGSYDGEALASWLGAVQRACAETGHLESRHDNGRSCIGLHTSRPRRALDSPLRCCSAERERCGKYARWFPYGVVQLARGASGRPHWPT